MQFVPGTYAASGLLSSSMELLAFASCQIAPKIMDLSVRFIRIYSILVSEQSGAKRIVYYMIICTYILIIQKKIRRHSLRLVPAVA